MKKSSLALVAGAAVLVLLGTALYFHHRHQNVPGRQPPGAVARVERHACNSLLYSERPTVCGRFYPAGESGRFYLPFAVFSYEGSDASSEPLVYISGGPGGGMQTHVDSLQAWAYWLDETDLKRDLVIFDQRGLKPGEPYWDCDAYNQINEEILAKNLSLAREYQITSAVLQQCLKEFDAWLKSPAVAVPAGLKGFSTVTAAAELNSLLRLLGYSRWHLWGVSYGSRLALVAAQQQPDSTASLLLDSPYPLDRGELSSRPAMYAAALQKFWDVCTHNAEFCGVDVADPEALFWRVTERLEQQPFRYRVRGSNFSSAMSVVLNDHRFFSLALFALYDHRFYRELLAGLVLLDKKLKEEQGGARGIQAPTDEATDPVRFLLNSFVASALDESFNSMIFFAIECNDNPLQPAAVYNAAARAQPVLWSFLAFDGDYNPCHSPLFISADLLNPQPAPVAPALILTGELDPVTPVDWGKALARQLPNAHLVVAPRVGHAVLSSGVCKPALFNAFLDAPAPAGAAQAVKAHCF